MIAASDPYQVIGGFGLAFLFLAGLWWLINWVREAPIKPDPWDAEVEQKLSEPEAVEVCPHCLTPQPPTAWFCKRCGKAVGPYNNLMPFLNVFSEGEVLRNGISDRFRNRPFIAAGYLLISLSFILALVVDYPLIGVGILSFVALFYWVSVLRNLKRPPDRQESDDTHGSPSEWGQS